MKSLYIQFKEFIHYGIVVSIGLGIDVGLLYILITYTTIGYLWGTAISFFTALIFNYVLSTKKVFAYRSVVRADHEFMIFAGVGISALTLNQIIIYFGVEILLLPILMSKLIAIPCTFLWNFGWNKFLLFTQK